MFKKNNKKRKHAIPLWFIVVPIIGILLLLIYLIRGKNIALLNPQGFIANQQRSLIVFTVAVLLAVVVPTLLLFYFMAWKYRETNASKEQNSEKRCGKYLVAAMWIFPTLVMLILVSVMVPATHNLVPQKAIAGKERPLTIQVITMRWKWLFIYPEQHIATLNFVQIPINTPVTFEMTSDETPMSSFWIPSLGGQLYTMTSHVNRLNLMAEKAGDYTGSSAEINGAGFAGMKFTARVGNLEDFDLWVQTVKDSPEKLDKAAYLRLLEPSEYNPPAFYSAFNPNLFAGVIKKYQGEKGSVHH